MVRSGPSAGPIQRASFTVMWVGTRSASRRLAWSSGNGDGQEATNPHDCEKDAYAVSLRRVAKNLNTPFRVAPSAIQAGRPAAVVAVVRHPPQPGPARFVANCSSVNDRGDR